MLSINGRRVSGSTELTREVARTTAGGTMRLEVRRGGQTRELTVIAGRRPSAATLNRGDNGTEDATPTPGAKPAPASTVLGMDVAALDAAARRDNSIGPDVRGAVITAVAPNSDAQKKGLRKGDVIVQANERSVSSPADFAAAVADARKAGRPSVFLLVNRAGRNNGVPVKIDAAKPPS